jgi:hypothetical protein
MITRPTTFAERMVLLEAQADQCAQARLDVEQRLRRLEMGYWIGTTLVVGLQLALKFFV